SFSVFLSNFGISLCVLVLIYPATYSIPVVTVVSQATVACGSFSNNASSIESDIWSHILSACPSVTDSDVDKCLAISLYHLSFIYFYFYFYFFHCYILLQYFVLLISCYLIYYIHLYYNNLY